MKDVCLEIPHGEFVGIIGHTGSGKSTLIQHLNGLVKATSGALYYEGKNIYEPGYNMRELRNQVGLVFQYPEHQLFEVDVMSDVCFGPKNQGLNPSHSMEDIARYADRIIVMNKGEVMYNDCPRKVFEHYRELEQVGLAAPQVTYIMHDLKEQGFAVEPNVTTVEEAAAQIKKALEKRK